MRRRSWVFLVLIILTVAAVAFWWALRPDGRLYQGRTEHDWIASLANQPGVKEMQQWQALGPEAVPMLARALGQGTSPVLRWYRNFRSRMPISLQRHLPRSADTVGIRRS